MNIEQARQQIKAHRIPMENLLDELEELRAIHNKPEEDNTRGRFLKNFDARMMDCASMNPMDVTFCDVNKPCEQCPRFADDCDGEENFMEHPDEWYDPDEWYEQ